MYKPCFTFQIIHAYLWISPVYSSTSNEYFFVFLDDYFHYLWMFPLDSKIDVYDILVNFHKLYNAIMGRVLSGHAIYIPVSLYNCRHSPFVLPLYIPTKRTC